MFEIVSFYRFLDLNDDEIKGIEAQCRSFEQEIGLRGLLISAYEGLNGTVACPQGQLVHFTDYLEGLGNIIDGDTSDPDPGDWKYKYSTSLEAPYKRFSFKHKPEIVTSGRQDLVPQDTADHLSPEEWHAALESGEDIALIDVRNDYEVQIGTFKNAINPETADFKEFPDFIKNSGIPKDKKVLMCCTGGIRCEKAYLEMKEEGYQDVKQLDGGILTYMEKFPDGYFSGECFVFDDRVAVDAELKPSKIHALCPHCGDPAQGIISCKMCDREMKVCESCLHTPHRHSCSKNCAYHLKNSFQKENRAQEKSRVSDKVILL